MDFIDFTAGADDEGRRMDRIVRGLLPAHSLGMVYKYLRKGLIRRNGSRIRPEARVQEGDTISIAAFLLQDAPIPGIPPCWEEAAPKVGEPVLQDLFVNPHVRIISKPYGIPVQGGGRSPISLDRLIVRDYLRQQRESGAPPSLSFRPGPLHRLDRRTTGVLAFSQSLAGARWFSRALRERIVGKEYLALAEGRLERRACWTDQVHHPQRTGGGGEFVRSEIKDEGKEARTAASPVAWGQVGGIPLTLLHLEISTGRTHQIRLQCAAHGLPLLGDTVYGGHVLPAKAKADRPRQDSCLQDLFLHAWRLSVPPDNPLGLPATVEAPLPEGFRDMLETCLPDRDMQGYII